MWKVIDLYRVKMKNIIWVVSFFIVVSIAFWIVCDKNADPDRATTNAGIQARRRTNMPPEKSSEDIIMREKMEACLKTIVISDLVLNDASIDIVAKFLSDCSLRADPERKGVKILATDIDSPVTVTFLLKPPGMSLYDILNKISVETNLRIVIEADAVFFCEKKKGKRGHPLGQTPRSIIPEGNRPKAGSNSLP